MNWLLSQIGEHGAAIIPAALILVTFFAPKIVGKTWELVEEGPAIAGIVLSGFLYVFVVSIATNGIAEAVEDTPNAHAPTGFLMVLALTWVVSLFIWVYLPRKE